MKKLVIFDLDGTLIDTIPDIAENVNKTLKEFGFKERSTSEILGFVNYGAEKLLRDSIGEKIEEDLFQKAFSFYKLCYKNSTNEKSVVYSGIYNLLEKLKGNGAILCVYSNKQDEVVQNLINARFSGVFDSVTGFKQGAKTKPDPSHILSLIKRFNVDSKNVYMVGDGDTDILVGINSGVHSVGVSWGYRNKEVLISLGAEFIADTASAVYDFIFKG